MLETSHLAKTIAELCPHNGSHPTSVEGLYLTRSSTTEVPRNTLDRAVFCVVAQGAKSTLMLNQPRLLYGPGSYLIVSLDLPLVGQIEQASAAEPFLGCSLVLDFKEIGALIHEAKLTPGPASLARSGLVVGTLGHDLLDAVTRLVSLLKRPAEIQVLAPLIRREVFYKLLLSEGSGLLHRMAAERGKTERIAAGLGWLRRNAARRIRMEELAREMCMSPSSMHSCFRAATSMSPLQFQKQLRLQNARRMMLSEAVDAGTASRRVGYQSASQFSREYRRFFGEPPLRDIERLRGLVGAGSEQPETQHLIRQAAFAEAATLSA